MKLTLQQEFAARLRMAFHLSGLTQTALARRANYSGSAIHNFLTGKRLPTIEGCERLAAALGIRPLAFIKGFNFSIRVHPCSSVAKNPATLFA